MTSTANVARDHGNLDFISFPQLQRYQTKNGPPFGKDITDKLHTIGSRIDVKYDRTGAVRGMPSNAHFDHMNFKFNDMKTQPCSPKDIGVSKMAIVQTYISKQHDQILFQDKSKMRKSVVSGRLSHIRESIPATNLNNQ